MKNMSSNEIKKYLSDNNIKPSLPRVKIFEYLIQYKSHPTVDEIYIALVDELVTLSKTTVYNTLNLFLKNNIINQILIEENETRYDADMKIHGHFKCNKCGKVYDFDYDLSKIKISDLYEFTFTEYHTYIKGICKNCNVQTQTDI
ncbi:MAG: Fur family transcriptional regulator [Bacillota bacterium]|nr:Fur family transcriptional regulator [Bacillota bacterium]